jgi:hypothetical protein
VLLVPVALLSRRLHVGAPAIVRHTQSQTAVLSGYQSVTVYTRILALRTTHKAPFSTHRVPLQLALAPDALEAGLHRCINGKGQTTHREGSQQT